MHEVASLTVGYCSVYDLITTNDNKCLSLEL